jgi:dihydroorotate dehydrogenase
MIYAGLRPAGDKILCVKRKVKYLRGDMYKILRSILFFFPAEGVHHFSMKGLRLLCSWELLRRLVAWSCRPEEGDSGDGARGIGLERQVFGLAFRNPAGLGAGFDKNALYLRELEALGFGFVEIGTVTPLAQAGNERPRLFRLPQDQALVNRMGFNNEGVEVIAERLRAWRRGRGLEAKRGNGQMIIGGNIGKNKLTPNEDAWKDYEICFRALYGSVDYFVVNVSSPNTPGLRELQDKEALRRILTNLQGIGGQLAKEKGGRTTPLLLKIAPDLNQQQLDDVIALALEIRLDGLVATNTTIGRDGLLSSQERVKAIGAGGLSGAPLRERATEVVEYLCRQCVGRIPVIASGGIFTAADAREKMDAGAALVQVWTGFIYEGPFIVARICRGVER